MDLLANVNPPSPAWIEQIVNPRDLLCWSVYVLVLKKDGCRILVYIGSATSYEEYRIYGFQSRLYTHLQLTSVQTQQRGGLHRAPQGIKDAVADGFQIAYTHVLFNIPVPDSADMVRHRAFVLVVEILITHALGGLATAPYTQVQQLCPPSIHTLNNFEYDGICTHNAVKELTPGLHLSPQQREEVDMMRAHAFIHRHASEKAGCGYHTPHRMALDQHTIAFHSAVLAFGRDICGGKHPTQAALDQHVAYRHNFK